MTSGVLPFSVTYMSYHFVQQLIFTEESVSERAIFFLLLRKRIWKMMWFPGYWWRWDPPPLSHKRVGQLWMPVHLALLFYETCNIFLVIKQKQTFKWITFLKKIKNNENEKLFSYYKPSSCFLREKLSDTIYNSRGLYDYFSGQREVSDTK